MEQHDAGIKTGVVSNFDTRLPGILDGLGISALFDSVTISAGLPHQPECQRNTTSLLAHLAESSSFAASP